MSLIGTIIVTLVVAATSIVLSELLRPKPDIEDAKPASLGDFTFPTAIEGRVIPLVFGTVQLSGPNVIWWGDFNATKITEKVKTGMFSSKRITTGFAYHVGLQMALCMGQIDQLSKVWIGDTVVATGTVQDGTYTITDYELFGGSKFGQGGVDGVLRVHSGSPTQTASSYLSGFQTPCIPHRDTCYVTWEGGYIGNATTIKPWKFELSRWPNGLGMAGGKEKIGVESNPACILYELMTDDDWGFGLPSSDVSAASLQAAGNTLYTEGNGFSIAIDRGMEALDLLKLLQEQIDGIVYLDPEDGLFKLSLARDDYDIDLVPQLTESNIVEVREFTRGTWEETSNQVRTEFTDRSRDYFGTYGQAHDLGNQRIQGGELVPVTLKFPGCKDKTLATALANREIRQLAIPLAKATIVVDRTFWDVKPNDVLAWTDQNLGFTKLPMRVVRIDYGDLQNGQIVLSLIQDVFKVSASFFGEPDDTLWDPPTQNVAELDEAMVVEAPYGILRRDPDNPGQMDRIWAGARRNTGGEVVFQIYQRNASGTPSGSYTEDSDDITEFLLIGELTNDVSPGREDGTATIAVEDYTGGDSIDDLEAKFTQNAAAADIGSNLVNLVYIDGTNGGEWVGVTSVLDQTSYLDLQGCWRGLLGTAAGSHVAGDKVYLAFVGGDLNQSSIAQSYNVDVQLRARSFHDTTTEGEATVFQLQMDDVARRPYPPTMLEVNTTYYDTTVDADTQKPTTSGLDNRGLHFEWIRRDWLTFDETQGVGTDANSIDDDFPTKDTTRYDVEVYALRDSLLTGLEAHWKLEEASGTRYDETANDYDLSPSGSPGRTTGKVGTYSLDLDAASSQYLEAAASTVLNHTGDFSFAGWFKVDDQTADRTLLSKWDDTTASPQRQYRLYYDNASDRFKFDIRGTATTTVTANSYGAVPASTWVFIYVEHDTTDDVIRIQVNNGYTDEAAHSTGISSSTASFRVGAIIDSGGSDADFMDGQVDSVSAYDRGLTRGERSLLYVGGTGIDYPFAGEVTLLNTGFVASASDAFLSRTDIVEDLDGGLPTDVRVEVDVDHDIDGTVRTALQVLKHEFAITASVLDDDDYLGEMPQNTISWAWLNVPDTGTYTFTIGSDVLATGIVEARINGGGWGTVISTGNTTGTLTSVTAGDTIEARHTEPSISGNVFMQIDPPTSTEGAYAILT
jgi:hypothetical protein